jgi:hypothetical protein
MPVRNRVPLRPLAHRTRLAIRQQFEDDTINTIRYVPSTLEVIQSGDKLFQYEQEDTFVVWWFRRIKKKKQDIHGSVHLNINRITNSEWLIGTFKKFTYPGVCL